MKKFFLFLIVTFLVIVVIIGFDVYKKIFVPYKGYKNSIVVQIEKGSSVSNIAKLLYQKNIIPSYTYFVLYYRLFFASTHLKSGEYEFNKRLNMKEIIKKLKKGKVLLYKITIKEGMTIEETADFLEKNHNLNQEKFIQATNNINLISALDEKATDLEGYLYPDTYLVQKGITPEKFVGLMVDKFKKNFSNSMLWRAKDLNFTIREIISLASLIEKETSLRSERFLISSVFHNRLKIKMPLGCDPTIIYALKKAHIYTGKIRWKDLEYDSPYNTRIHKGIPPGPICSPGFASIEAALFPEDSLYLYFVAKDIKSHYFSKTLKEHNWAVKKYIINRKQ